MSKRVDDSQSFDENKENEQAEGKAIGEMIQGIFSEISGPNEQTLVIRHDAKKLVYEQQKVAIIGLLDTPARYLQKRVKLIDQQASHLIVNRDALNLTLTVHEEDYFQHTLKGALEINKDFKAFGINTGQTWDGFRLGDFIRMNRSFFETKEIAMKFVSDLKSFKATVTQEKEKVQKQGGDFKSLFDQTVKHNLPESFTLTIPVFKGYKAETFTVEVHVSPDDFSLQLISPDAKDLQQELKDRVIDEQLKEIREIAPDLLITEE